MQRCGVVSIQSPGGVTMNLQSSAGKLCESSDSRSDTTSEYKRTPARVSASSATAKQGQSVRLGNLGLRHA
jgi:hypothetical protein